MKFSNQAKWLFVAVLVAVNITTAWYLIGQRNRVAADLQEQVRGALLKQDSLEVALDTTVSVLIDSLAVARRRAYQVTMQRDRLDSLLERESRLRSRVELSFERFRDSVTSEVAVDPETGFRAAHFDTYRPPIHVDVDVQFDTAVAHADIGVEVDPILLEVRAQCGKQVRDNLRPVDIAVTTPAEFREVLSIHVGDSFVDSEMCNPAPAPPPSFWQKTKIAAPPTILGTAIGVILGVIFGG